MSFKSLPAQTQGVELLTRSLERGRVAHGYLFNSHSPDDLERIARTLAKTLNCLQPVKKGAAAVDCCDECLTCRKIDHDNHPDVHWVRPESKSRVITIEQMRDLLQAIHLKPAEAKFKVAVIVASDRLNEKAANAFLKTLEEPPPGSVLILLTTEPQRILETLRSRCLRLNFGGEGIRRLEPAERAWLTSFSDLAAAGQKSLLGRYRLMDVLLKKLTALKTTIEEALTARSPLQRYKDAEKDLVEKWEDELKAAIEAEYRRQRSDLLLLLQWWMRDVWLHSLGVESRGPEALLNFPEIGGAAMVAQRISPTEALDNLRIMEQLQRSLHTNVQEALALEVGLLKLRF